MEDYLTIKMPEFKPKYRRWKCYGWKRPKERENTRDVLLEAGRGYCMYCYVRIQVAGKCMGNLEHAIEKNNSARLEECVPNIGIACPVCNGSFKKMGEKQRKLGEKQIQTFHGRARCTETKRKQCTVPCRALKDLQADYYKKEDAQIILQPMGARGPKSHQPLRIQYDVLNAEFQADDNALYDEEDRAFIRAHIQRFHLNDPEYRTSKLLEFIKVIIDQGGKVPVYEYNNLVVELFAEKLKGKTREDVLKICEPIYIILNYSRLCHECG